MHPIFIIECSGFSDRFSCYEKKFNSTKVQLVSLVSFIVLFIYIYFMYFHVNFFKLNKI